MAKNTVSEAPEAQQDDPNTEQATATVPEGTDTPQASAEAPEAQPAPPVAPEAPKPDEPKAPRAGNRKIKNESCKGLTITAVTGRPVVFDQNGVAECLEADYQQFKRIPGYEDVK